MLDNQVSFKAGQLRFFAKEWETITSDPFILDTVSHCHVEFVELPSSALNTVQSEHNFSQTEREVIDGEIAKFLLQGIIIPSIFEHDQVLSPIFVRPKKDGSYRVIFNLKKLNRCVEYNHFKMDTLETAVRLMKPSSFMSSLDLKNAYYSVPIALEQQKYFKFIWENKLYQFTCLPMGLSSSPRVSLSC